MAHITQSLGKMISTEFYRSPKPSRRMEHLEFVSCRRMLSTSMKKAISRMNKISRKCGWPEINGAWLLIIKAAAARHKNSFAVLRTSGRRKKQRAKIFHTDATENETFPLFLPAIFDLFGLVFMPETQGQSNLNKNFCFNIIFLITLLFEFEMS